MQRDEVAARRIAQAVRCVRVKPGRVVIKQGALGNDFFFILRGTVDVFVNGTKVATRSAGHHFGEMAGLLGTRRTATVVAGEESLLAKVAWKDFLKVAKASPMLAMNLVQELAARLNQRRNLMREPNFKPFIFIGSSTKHRCVAEAIRDGLSGLDADIQVWSDDGAFPASETFIETLSDASKRADFAILVFGKDDIVISKGRKSYTTRDNVVFEAGLFIGAISRQRTFLVQPKNARIRILTDLAGVTLLHYRKTKGIVEVSSACAQIKAAVRKQRVR